MGQLTQAAIRLRDWLGELSLGARLAAVGLLAVVLVGLAWMFAAAGRADQFLMNGEAFSSSRLSAMEAAFAKAGLHQYRIDGNRIRVPRGQHASYMAALADADALPPSFNDYLEKALADDSVLSNRRDKEMRMKVATQNELANIIRQMAHIEDASVLYDIKETRRGLDREEIITASVSVKTTGGQPLEAKQVAAIRNLVAGAIAGLERDKIAVADLSGRAYPGGGQEELGDPLSDPYYARKRMYEETLERKIADSLVYVPGVVVQVNAELDPEIRHVQESLKPNPRTVAQRVRTQTSLGSHVRPDHTPAAVESRQPQAFGPSSGTTTLRPPAAVPPRVAPRVIDEQTDSVVGYDRISSERRGLIPTLVRVTVVVPSSYYQQLWQQRHDAPVGRDDAKAPQHELDQIEAEVTQSIKNAVLALLPTSGDLLSQSRQVSVTTFQAIAPSPEVKPQPGGRGLADWITRYWRAAAWAALGIALLLLARAFFAGSENRRFAQPEVVPFTTDDPQHRAPGQPAEQARRPIVRDDLANIVSKDPDAAASVLRNWISSAS